MYIQINSGKYCLLYYWLTLFPSIYSILFALRLIRLSSFLLIFLFYVCLPNFCPHLQSVYSLYLAFSSFLLLTTFTFCSLFLSLHITLYPGVSAELCVLSTHNPKAASIHLTTFCNQKKTKVGGFFQFLYKILQYFMSFVRAK